MSSINNLVPMTELDAVNAMLAVIGESPISNVDTATQADVAQAIATLRDTARECLALGWKFNMEYGFELKPIDTFSWTDSSGVTTVLNIFAPPADLISGILTRSIHQWKLDATIRPARFYRSPSVSSLTNAVFEEFTNTVAPNVPGETLLAYIDGDGRQLWSQVQNLGTPPVIISIVPAGLVRMTPLNVGGSVAEFKNALVPPTGDYSATIRIPAYTLAAGLSLAGFYVTIRNQGLAGTEYYRGRLNFNSSGASVSAVLEKINATAFSVILGTAAVDLSSGWNHALSHTVTVQGVGSSVLLFVDGVFVSSFNGVANTAAGLAGFGWTVNESFGGGDAVFIDSFATSFLTFKNTGTIPLVFYDTFNHRDGFDSTLVPFLYIDGKFSMDFEQMPQEARKYITIRAARQFAARAVESNEIEAFTHNDELFALRELKRAHGQEDDYNILDAAPQYLYGRRNRQATGFFDARTLPGHS